MDNSLTPSKLLHDLVSHASTILSISQMAIFSYSDMTAEMKNDIQRIMDTAHAIVEDVEKLGQLIEDDEEDE